MDLPQRQRIAGYAASVERERMRNPYQRCLPGGLRRDGPAATAANRGKRCQCGKGIDWGTGKRPQNGLQKRRILKRSSAPPSTGTSASHVFASPFGRCRRKWRFIVTFCSSHSRVPVLRCFCRPCLRVLFQKVPTKVAYHRHLL